MKALIILPLASLVAALPRGEAQHMEKRQFWAPSYGYGLGLGYGLGYGYTYPYTYNRLYI
jgi:uncharacterized membrane protein YedE/YeeE